MSERVAELDRLIVEALEKIGEHADAVQILATFNEEGLTHRIHLGCGNWYARQGLAQEFIQCDKAQTEAAEIGKVINRRDDDDSE